jgi:hypothetical protein
LKPNITAAPKKASVKPKKAACIGAKPGTAPLIVADPPTSSPLKDILDLLDSSPLEACVLLTGRMLASITTVPKGAARPQDSNPFCC